jgi:hypothetical protein
LYPIYLIWGIFNEGIVTMVAWTDEQIDAWCLSFRSYREDSMAIAKTRDLQQQRCRIRQEVLHSLTAFLDGRNSLQEFHEALQYQAHPDWNLFGLHGLSGTTFLKTLVQKAPYKEQLTQHLRSVLLLPKDVRDAHTLMRTFHHFLEGMITVSQMSRAQLQPARVPFFLSLWWYIQESEAWPRFTGDLRQRLLSELPLPEPSGNPIDLYFSFRERFLALKTAFGISTWELEQFLLWQKQQEQKREKAVALTGQKSGQISLRNEASRRLYLQWLLAKMGRRVGCQVWIARQDQEKSWKEEGLGQLSIPVLPVLENVSSATLLEEVAVLWLLKEEVIAVFEIALNEEDITTSLLRLYDLSLTLSRRRTRFCLVLPNQHFEQAHRAFSRPLFRQQQERHQCALASEENFTEHGEHILRWATSPSVIEDIVAFSMV